MAQNIINLIKGVADHHETESAGPNNFIASPLQRLFGWLTTLMMAVAAAAMFVMM